MIAETTTEASDTTIRPPTAQGMPEAPSAAMEDRLRRPIIIMMPQAISPATPAMRATHLNHE
jgi:hypothetical protein